MAQQKAVSKRGVKPSPSTTRPAPAPARRRVVSDENYFASMKKETAITSTGCAILDCVLGGGYPLGRIVNLVGDKSTGKTLMAIEASANFLNAYQDARIRYAEVESAFDKQYAEALGMPVDQVEFADDIYTVEDFYEDLEKTLDELNGRPCLYILDSLDAISDRAELERDIDKGSYGGEKPKKMGELFRRLVQKLEASRVLLIIISQIRDKIGVTFGKTKMRTGGKALDFYASVVIWLSEVEKLKRTVNKIDRIVGIQVRAKCEKNKIGLPFRECSYPILFGYGVDDLTANAEWLLEVNREECLAELGLSKAGYKIRINNLRNGGGEEVKELRRKMREVVSREWQKIEISFLPKARKY